MGNLIDDLVQVARMAGKGPKLHVARSIEAETESSNRRLSMEWISVKDRLPSHRMVLGWDGEHQFCMMIGGKLMAYYGDSKGWVEPEFAITYWMPLPEPPTEKAE